VFYAHPLLLFLCVAKEKVTKRKATFFEMLRTKKGAIRCVRKALIGDMALVFLPIPTTIKLCASLIYFHSILLRNNLLRHKKGAIICSTSAFLSPDFNLM